MEWSIVTTPLGFLAGFYTKRWGERGLAAAFLQSVKVDVDMAATVEVPADVQDLTKRSSWLPELRQRATAEEVMGAALTAEAMLANIPETLGRIDRLYLALDAVATGTASQKMELVRDLVDPLIHASLTGGLARREVQLAMPSGYDPMTQVIEWMVNDGPEGGYIMHLGEAGYVFSYERKELNQFLKPAVLAIAHFDVSNIRRMLDYVRSDLSSTPGEMQRIKSKLRTLIPGLRRLVVDVVLINYGRQPCVVLSWCVLRAFPAGRFNGASVVLQCVEVTAANQSEPPPSSSLKSPKRRPEADGRDQGHLVVAPGQVVSVKCHSVGPADEGLLDLIQSEALEAKISMIQTDLPLALRWYRRETFVDSPLAPVGKTGMPKGLDEGLLRHAGRMRRR